MRIKNASVTLVAALSALALIVSACSQSSPTAESSSASTDGSQSSDAPVASSDGASTAEPASGSPIKIGLIPPTSGNIGASGQAMKNGWELYWKEHNNASAGRPVDNIFLDTGGDVGTALTNVNQLVNSDGVSLVVGALQANIAAAVAPVLADAGVPYIEPIGAEDDLTQRKIPATFLRLAGETASQASHAQGAYALELGYKRVVTLCADYAYGYQSCGGFVNTFTDGGGEVQDQIWAPVGTQDYSGYVTQIQALKPEFVYAELQGSDGARFLNSWSSFGAKESIPLLTGETITLGLNLAHGTPADYLGILSVSPVPGADANPDIAKLSEAYEAAYGEPLSLFSINMYAAAMWVDQAIQKLNGDVSDSKALLETLKNIKLAESPLGPVALDKYNNPVLNVYVRKVVDQGGKLVNETVKTFKDVSQFWTYDPEEFLQHPVYSKEYQGNGVWPNPVS